MNANERARLMSVLEALDKLGAVPNVEVHVYGHTVRNGEEMCASFRFALSLTSPPAVESSGEAPGR